MTSDLSRRHFLGGVAVTAASGLLLPASMAPDPSGASAASPNLTVATPVRMAMHVHSSFSEGGTV